MSHNALQKALFVMAIRSSGSCHKRDQVIGWPSTSDDLYCAHTQGRLTRLVSVNNDQYLHCSGQVVKVVGWLSGPRMATGCYYYHRG